MRLNFLGGQSTTGGAGALTLTAAGGLALPASALIADSIVEYSAVEYTDSTLATVSKAETGHGLISSGNVLTRSAPKTTWDGATYVQASATALSFGTSNVRVYIAPIAEGGVNAFPARLDLSANYGFNGYIIPANLWTLTDLLSLGIAANRQYMTPIKLEAGFPISQLGIEVKTAAASSTAHVALASVHPTTGVPGRILAAANNLDVSTTGVKLGSITSRLFPGGWYWALVSTNGAPNIVACEGFLPGPFGLGGAGPRIHRACWRARTHATYTVGADAMTGLSGSYNQADNVGWPIPFMR